MSNREHLLQAALDMFRLGFTNEIVSAALVCHEAIDRQNADQIAHTACLQWLAILRKNTPLPALSTARERELLSRITRPMPVSKSQGPMFSVDPQDIDEA